MPESIYPAIAPGLKVRHRETLEERTVGAVSNDRVYFQGRLVWSWVRHLWDVYEPLPQPGDRVRVVRSAQRHTDCIGSKGELIHSIGGVYAVLSGHNGPLSDFEVILPEANVSEPELTDIPPHESSVETNMTDNETVAVPVDDLREWADQAPSNVGAAIRSYIPKPKPRLVAVTREQWVKVADNSWFDDQPGLLETLDAVIDSYVAPRSEILAHDVKGAIRMRLGVDPE